MDLRIRNLTLPTPGATTIIFSSTATTATAAAMSSATATTISPTTTAATTTTTSTFFTYSIPGMDIAPGPFIFTYVSEFLSLITPEELPLGKLHENEKEKGQDVYICA
ncbi:GH20897 [Drosophila grimshawi]|uniref:GH20897 n=1 Tax=Drosophila grimshawi TaxID=7222 RepID=B4J4V2_DROGR|nr:GH20897 [Drosophila grimshawi]